MKISPTQSGGRVLKGDTPHGAFHVEWGPDGSLVEHAISFQREDGAFVLAGERAGLRYRLVAWFGENNLWLAAGTLPDVELQPDGALRVHRTSEQGTTDLRICRCVNGRTCEFKNPDGSSLGEVYAEFGEPEPAAS